MSKRIHKFYQPGTLDEKGTKITLKTQPYTNGVVFNMSDPITSFHSLLMATKVIVDEYEMLRNVPGINSALPSALDLNSGLTGRIKLLLNFLSQSPIEITLKEQPIDENIITDLAATGVTHE